MSDSNNGTVAGTNRIADTADPAPKKGKGKDKSTAGFYARMGKLCKKQSLTLKVVDGEGTATLAVASFPHLTPAAVAEAARTGCKTTFKPHDGVGDKSATASGSAEGQGAADLAKDFFAIESAEE